MIISKSDEKPQKNAWLCVEQVRFDYKDSIVLQQLLALKNCLSLA